MAEKRKIGAYALIKLGLGKSRTLTEQISGIECVKTAHPVAGMFDTIT